MWYMPNIGSEGFEYTGAAIVYLFAIWNEYEEFPEKLSKESAKLSLNKMFSGDEQMLGEIEHRIYRKYAKLGGMGIITFIHLMAHSQLLSQQ